jgi:hypothetical protein
LIAGLVIGIGVLIAALVLFSSVDEADPTTSAVAPPPASAIAPNEGATRAGAVGSENAAEGDARRENVDEPGATSDVDVGGEERANETEATAATDREPVEQAVTESGARTPRARAAAERRARARARRAAPQSSGDGEAAMAPAAAPRGMNRPRAGSLSLDDF